ncbi:8-oxo-dGTP pyrophosphatase MutT (NUDIX family) [Nocardia tenerifensis]|uniref:8-oxo-dGTP pyrophosphatase MutT (NUDIX family) n=1 Tax=Nocardia tenerifensis TaxID=228006 RepID=A0A318JW53_9NOCA|nr:NUDIX domain-containing protein [Nocardia tenerifensis]PXX57693.1 8-oxo-dGTP pyrophosphatase MutT (NUDIX family) [Nocardia tenerifensis]
MNSATRAVAEIVSGIAPFDALEQQHVAESLTWLAATDDVFRRVKPATPPRHLVSYVVMVDPEARAVLLGHHRLAELWLPTGGHVDPGEHPLETARRETAEEVGVSADFTVTGTDPLFLTITATNGPDSHEDVSLWYVIRGDHTRRYALDAREFSSERWCGIDGFGIANTDPHFRRFLAKLNITLARS